MPSSVSAGSATPARRATVASQPSAARSHRAAWCDGGGWYERDRAGILFRKRSWKIRVSRNIRWIPVHLFFRGTRKFQDLSGRRSSRRHGGTQDPFAPVGNRHRCARRPSGRDGNGYRGTRGPFGRSGNGHWGTRGALEGTAPTLPAHAWAADSSSKPPWTL